MIKKIISLLLVVALCGAIPAVPGFAEEYWIQEDSYGMQFMPEDGYMSIQNSPCFKWPLSGDKYDLKIYSDANMKKEIESVMGIKKNVYVFDHKLPEGVHLYWRVRYWKNGTVSSWSELREFKIKTGAYEYTLPSYDALLQRVPENHPRIWFTEDTLAEKRSYKDTNARSKEIFDYYYAQARKITDENVFMAEPEAPTSFDDYAAQGNATLNIRLNCNAFREKIKTCGYIYMLTGEKDIGRYAAKGIVELSSWDTAGVTSYYYDDMNAVWLALTIGTVYDWVHDLLTEDEKQIVFDSIRKRVKQFGFLQDSVYSVPNDSHGWTNIAYMGIMALGLYGDMPEAKEWFNKCAYIFAATGTPYSYQDGGHAHGTYYWMAAIEEYILFIDVLHLAGIASLYDSAWFTKQSDFYTYVYPKGSRGSFGDDSNNAFMREPIAYYNYRMAANSKNSAAKWFAEQFDPQYDMVDYFYAPFYDEIEAADPEKLPQARHFEDIGWVAMHSNIADENRVMMTFKSTEYGTYNHGGCDANAFIIEGFGENLAIKSGYYDGYRSRHNAGFTKKSYAHNTITVNGGKGQLDDNLDADGKITSFITGPEFDTCTGDATEAYMGRLGKYKRTMIYIRPDQFIVIDDLEAPKKDQKLQYEWWLNAEQDIRVYDDKSGARIYAGNAVLDAKLHYPEGCTPYYTDLFSGPDLVHIPATGGYADANIDKRVWFETPKLHSTKMVVTMDVHTKDNETKNVKREEFSDYLKLTFEDGTVALINLKSDNGRVVTDDDMEFTGEAVVYSDDTIMLTNGTYLKAYGTEIFKAEKTASLSLGLNELSVSTEEDNDVYVNLCNEYGHCCKRVTTFDGKELLPGIGVTTEGIKNGELSMKVEHGDYRMKFEKQDVTVGYAGKVEIDVVIDGVSNIHKLNGYKQADGTVNARGRIEVPAGKYKIVEKNRELSFDGMESNTMRNLSKVYVSTSALEGNRVLLESRKSKNLSGKQIDDYDNIKNTADAFVEAEDYDYMKVGYKYENGLVSGGKAITQLNGAGAEAAYTFNVPESGYYNIYAKYVCWPLGGAGIRNFTIGGSTFTSDLPFTMSWGISLEDWKAVEIPANVYLEKGENTMTVDATAGMWNYDWIALKKVK